MKTSKAVIWLSSLIVVLALVAAGIGLFWQDGASPFSFMTLRGQIVQIYGQGLYHYDTPLLALGNRAGDAVTLIVGIPLLVVSMLLYRRGSLRGGLLLTGALAYFLYYYGSIAFSTAYNPLFLIYVALFSASLFAFVLSLMSFDIAALPGHFSTRLPRRGIAVLMFVAALSLLIVWIGLSIVPALLQGKAPPEVASYTTAITDVVDLGVIVPALTLTGVLLRRREPLGYLLASTILVFTAVLGANLITGGIVQLLSGVITIGQFIGFTVPFAILALFDICLTVVLFRNFSESAIWESSTLQAAHA
jgi:hypothetical protein